MRDLFLEANATAAVMRMNATEYQVTSGLFSETCHTNFEHFLWHLHNIGVLDVSVDSKYRISKFDVVEKDIWIYVVKDRYKWSGVGKPERLFEDLQSLGLYVTGNK